MAEIRKPEPDDMDWTSGRPPPGVPEKKSAIGAALTASRLALTETTAGETRS